MCDSTRQMKVGGALCVNDGCKLCFLAVGLIYGRSCWNLHVAHWAACTMKFSLMPVLLQLTSVLVTCSQCSL